MGPGHRIVLCRPPPRPGGQIAALRLERLVNTSVNGAPQWHLQPETNRTLVALSGNWIAQEGRVPAFPESGLKDVPQGTALAFDTAQLGKWDTSLISFLWELKRSAREAHVDFRIDTLPESAHKLLDLLPEIPPTPTPPPPRTFAPVTAVGQFTLDTLNEIGCVSEMGTAAARGGIAALVGRGMMRTVDLMSDLAAAGPAALLIVGVVNFLVGAILAFVGSVELHKFAADIYVASLVAIAMVREMSAVMTAIIMAGRTGGAYAARISTMQANEEIDALQVFGIPIASYLILPSVLALGFTMPLLYLYGCLIGMLGGFVVSFIMLHVSPLGYFHETLQALPLDQFTFGFIKSLVFGVFVGLTSCRIGLKAGRSAADVGIAATKAVVVGIVGVIALDAVFAVIANVIGI
ncbi:ABC transporter permease protein [Komagataeibacter medellinensis NBRC 3288]|uniref:ABC transporter permease protein n=1 Tax=Komagataeibacter medellinensis (strain NBRC 3288 / BCRC 11682 / LMG 1693 / Kondo 51) TaxID=634177 RepID=G2I6L9_KOMMN|nr:ABC transporter permease protein [Komagataeibacter medellinensis NBRC 3288]